MARMVFMTVVLAAAVLTAVMWLWDPGGQVDPNLPSTETAGRPEKTGARPSALPGPDSEHGRERIEAAGEPTPSETASASAETAGQVTGTVLDRDSETPIEGALVFIGPDVPTFNITEAGWIASVRSDEEGEFAFQGLASAPHRIRVTAPDRQGGEVRSVFPGEDKKILLSTDPGIPCRLLVETAESVEPLPEKKVILEARSLGWELSRLTDQLGTFQITGIDGDWLEFADESWMLRIVVPGYLDPTLERNNHALEPGYTLTVQQGTTVSGQVVDKDRGTAIAGAEVVADSGHSVNTDGSGCFTISGVFDTLCAQAPGYAMAARELVDVPGGIEFEDVTVLFELERGVALYGRVIDSGGQPIPDVRVGVASFALDLAVDDLCLERRILEAYSTTTDGEGRYRIENLSAQATDLPGLMELEVRPPGWHGGIEEEVCIKAPQGEVEHDIVLPLIRRFSGVVLDPRGEPLDGATVVMQGVGEDHYQLSTTDEEGRFHLSNLPFGPYHAVVVYGDETLLVRTVEIPSPEMILQIQYFQDVTGTVVRKGDGTPIPGLLAQLVYCFGALTFDESTVTDERGRFVFEGIPPGSYSLYFTQPGDLPIYHPLTRRHREDISVEQGPWTGVIKYRERPSGWAEFEFAVPQQDGALHTPVESVEVLLTSYRFSRRSKLAQTEMFRDQPLPGFIPEEGHEVLLGRGIGSFRILLREGEYLMRFILPSGEEDIVRDESVSINRGEVTKHKVVF